MPLPAIAQEKTSQGQQSTLKELKVLLRVLQFRCLCLFLGFVYVRAISLFAF